MRNREILFKSQRETIPPIPQEKRYIENLVDEVAGKELETKLSLPSSVAPVPTLVRLLTQLDQKNGLIVVSDILSTTNIIEKYNYGGQNFSVVNRPDHVAFIKVKTNKSVREDGIIIADEEKILLNGEKDFFRSEKLHDAVNQQEIFHLGTLKKRKDMLLINKGKRIYRLVLDTTRFLGESNQVTSSEGHTLKQIEIEYKGVRAPVTEGQQQTDVIEEIAGEIKIVRDEVKKSLEIQGIPTKITRQTKTDWLKKQLVLV